MLALSVLLPPGANVPYPSISAALCSGSGAWRGGAWAPGDSSPLSQQMSGTSVLSTHQSRTCRSAALTARSSVHSKFVLPHCQRRPFVTPV